MIILITHDYDEDYLNKFDEIIKNGKRESKGNKEKYENIIYCKKERF